MHKVPIRIPLSIPARQRVHPIVQDLPARLQRRLTSFKWLVTCVAGVSLPLARTVKITFICSVVDYLSHALCQLSQNRAMRAILG